MANLNSHSSKPFKVLDRVMPGRRRKKNLAPSITSTTERTRASSVASIVSLETPASSIEPPALQDKGPSELHGFVVNLYVLNIHFGTR